MSLDHWDARPIFSYCDRLNKNPLVSIASGRLNQPVRQQNSAFSIPLYGYTKLLWRKATPTSKFFLQKRVVESNQVNIVVRRRNVSVQGQPLCSCAICYEEFV